MNEFKVILVSVLYNYKKPTPKVFCYLMACHNVITVTVTVGVPDVVIRKRERQVIH